MTKPHTSANTQRAGEATKLEQTPRLPGEEIAEYYTSRGVPQGYTHRGQVIGAAIGPSASSQFLDVDILRRSWRIGATFGRIRWEDAAYYRTFPARVSHYAHDVSAVLGMRGRWASRRATVDFGLLRSKRMNYLFQTLDPFSSSDASFDVNNTTFTLRFIPHL